MKAYLIDEKYLLITSGNLTNSGIFVISGKENFEGRISSCDSYIVIQFLKYFGGIWKQSQTLDDFYYEIMAAYSSYITTEYTDKQTFRCLNRKKYNFKETTSSEGIEEIVMEYQKQERDHNQEHRSQISSLNHLIMADSDDQRTQSQTFSLNDIPPVGTLDHIPEVLRIVKSRPEGISYLDLGRLLRPFFGNGESVTDGANRKFGEEKGKFAAFLGLVSIKDSARGKIVTISNLGNTYMSMNTDNKNKIIKDIFFDKPIVVSIMRQSLESPDFNILEFLLENCKGATRATLIRKVGPLKELFSHISSICTEDELQDAMKLV